jgi:tetratricopeptide (TPR) repeat protein
MHDYSPADLKRLFKLPVSLIQSLVRNQYITASPLEGTTSYTFNDVLMLRAAGALKAAKIPAPKIITALRNLRNALPPGSILTAMALGAPGNDLTLREGASAWEVKSGTHAPPSERLTSHTATPLAGRNPRSARLAEAEAHYARGHALEDSDVDAARAAYLDALNAYSDHLEARINLGRLLHLKGELKQAEKVYRQAKSSSALLSFNLAILLEDLNREQDAIDAYREALAQDPHLYDAHFNLSRLHERAGQPREALRHLLAYRRHMRQVGP